MHILSFDTSTERLQVALLLDGKVVCERSLEHESDVSRGVFRADAVAGGNSAEFVADTTAAAPDNASLTIAHASGAVADSAAVTSVDATVGAPSNAAVTVNATVAAIANAAGNTHMATATSESGPALPRGRLTRKKLAPRQQMASALLPLIDQTLKEAGWPKSILECIVVGTGPGGFTAIRTGVVTARTLAQALNLPLVPVSLLEMYASVCQLPCAIVLAAGKDHFFVAAYDAAISSSSSSSSPAVAAQSQTYTGQIAETVSSAYVSEAEIATLLADCPTWAVPGELRQSFLAPSRSLIELPKVKNIATRQGQIAWNRLSLTMSSQADRESESATGASGEPSDCRRLLEQYPYSSVQPLYLRDPSITIKAATT